MDKGLGRDVRSGAIPGEPTPEPGAMPGSGLSSLLHALGVSVLLDRPFKERGPQREIISRHHPKRPGSVNGIPLVGLGILRSRGSTPGLMTVLRLPMDKVDGVDATIGNFWKGHRGRGATVDPGVRRSEPWGH